MDLEATEFKNICAGECQQKFNRATDRKVSENWKRPSAFALSSERKLQKAYDDRVSIAKKNDNRTKLWRGP
jgi:hypothetical protein